MAWHLRNQTAIAGVGMSALGRDTGKTAGALLADSFRSALADCGLKQADIDGLYVNAGVDVERLAENLGLECRYSMQTWQHGRLSAPIIQEAALVVQAGLANYVACVYAIDISARGGGFGGTLDREGYREGGGPHGEFPYYGMTSPGSGAALAWRKYMERYGATAEQLGAVCVNQRRHAALNPAAVMREPFALDDYMSSRQIVEPLRLLDFCVVNDGAVCVIVTTAERARALQKPPVYIAGMQGLRAGRNQFIFGRPGLGIWQQPEAPDVPAVNPVYDMAGIDRSAVDGLYIYDSFSPQVVFALEEFGFCGPGDAAAWLAEGRGALGGDLPINTNGGHLSEGMMAGWTHQVEIVRQLRGECGPRQIAGAEVLQYVASTGVSLIYTR